MIGIDVMDLFIRCCRVLINRFGVGRIDGMVASMINDQGRNRHFGHVVEYRSP